MCLCGFFVNKRTELAALVIELTSLSQCRIYSYKKVLLSCIVIQEERPCWSLRPNKTFFRFAISKTVVASIEEIREGIIVKRVVRLRSFYSLISSRQMKTIIFLVIGFLAIVALMAMILSKTMVILPLGVLVLIWAQMRKNKNKKKFVLFPVRR